jgi:DNA modification methylase
VSCYVGDVREGLRSFIAAGVRARTCVTSPPYWGLRDYGVAGQLGLEPTPDEYVANMVEVFRLVRDVLADDATVWLNIGDSYATGGGKVGAAPGGGKQGESWRMRGVMTSPNRMPIPGLKPKDLCGIPWRLAFALQADGWWLRQDIIWSKPNPMPESVSDRCTKAHEYLFLLSKRARYYFDAAAIAEPIADSSVARLAQDVARQTGSTRANGGAKTNGSMKAVSGDRRIAGAAAGIDGRKHNGEYTSRNKRSVWSIPTESFKEAHFATFPTALVEPCILAGSEPGDVVLDPFMGSGTTAKVAMSLGRQWIGCELNPEYAAMQTRRAAQRGLELLEAHR